MGNICPSNKEIRTKPKKRTEFNPLLRNKEKPKYTSENDSPSSNLEPKLYQSKLHKKEIEELVHKTNFTKEQILYLFQYFKKISAMIIDDDIIDCEEFEEALGLAGSKFATRLFEVSFQVYDVNGNGEIEKPELFLLLNSCLEDQFRLSLGKNELQNIVDQTFNEIDTDGSGTIDYEEYMIYAKLNPRIIENLKIKLPWLNKEK
ncbi:calcineurin b [Anaeramoeba flamelloides]|uniref:Calcineurin b n=1 Tax=Anaeramoeba flamelloides TaxID=1746091 RepID=A0AAV8ACR0_9EUKA|nr:calcineurin b [Anaeramoeba flamelloides]